MIAKRERNLFNLFDLFNAELEDKFHGTVQNPWTNSILGDTDENGNLVCSVDVPGIKEEDIQIEVIDGVLSVQGERKTTNSSYQVHKSMTIPNEFDSDKITAELKDGVLTLKMAPKELLAPKEVKRIPISTSK